MDADNTPVARISNDFLDYQYQVLGILGYMSSPDVTEICINRPGEVYLEGRDGWNRVDVPSLTFERARQFCTAVVNESNTGQRITDTDRSEEHTSELQSLMRSSYAVFCLKKKNKNKARKRPNRDKKNTKNKRREGEMYIMNKRVKQLTTDKQHSVTRYHRDRKNKKCK